VRGPSSNAEANIQDWPCSCLPCRLLDRWLKLLSLSFILLFRKNMENSSILYYSACLHYCPMLGAIHQLVIQIDGHPIHTVCGYQCTMTTVPIVDIIQNTADPVVAHLLQSTDAHTGATDDNRSPLSHRRSLLRYRCSKIELPHVFSLGF